MSDRFLGKVVAEKYRVESLILETDEYILYRATHLMMEKPVTLKVLSPVAEGIDGNIQSFADEARTVSRVFHPNILNITDYGTTGKNTPFIVFDDLGGITLREAIISGGPFTPERTINVVDQIASALTAAHSNGISHLALTNENVIIRRSPAGADEVKILNFAANRAKPLALVTAAEAAYLSPEQCALAPVDDRSDIYSLGILTYEMLTGGVPFSGNAKQELIQAHIDEVPPPMSAIRPGVPSQVEEVVLGALAKKPDLRYQSAEEFADDLGGRTRSVGAVGNLAGAPVDAAATVPAENNIWKTAFIVLAGVSLLSAAFIYLTSVKQTNPGTALTPDANSIPVQPVNPSTGATEQGLANMSTYNPDLYGNTNSGMPDMGGDGYDPWSRPGSPPSGAPPSSQSYGPGVPIYPVQPGGQQQVYIDPNNPNSSTFMPPLPGEVRTVIVPVNSNTNTAAPQPTPKGNKPAANANAQTSPTGTTPPANTAPATDPKATPKPKPTKLPVKPPETPKTDAPPAATGKPAPSGKTQDAQ